MEFFHGLVAHVVDQDRQTGERASAANDINAAMVKALWDNYQISRANIPASMMDWGELELHLHGTPTWYFDRRDSQGFAEVKRAGKITDPEWTRDKVRAAANEMAVAVKAQLEKGR